jgi:hypothetical protein
MQHEPWHFRPENGGQVSLETLGMQPVEPVAYRMNDVWGFDQDQLPTEPFDIEIRIQAATVLEGLEIFAQTVQGYMLENFGAYAREQFLEHLQWRDDYAEVRTCKIVMAG